MVFEREGVPGNSRPMVGALFRTMIACPHIKTWHLSHTLTVSFALDIYAEHGSPSSLTVLSVTLCAIDNDCFVSFKTMTQLQSLDVKVKGDNWAHSHCDLAFTKCQAADTPDNYYLWFQATCALFCQQLILKTYSQLYMALHSRLNRACSCWCSTFEHSR